MNDQNHLWQALHDLYSGWCTENMLLLLGAHWLPPDTAFQIPWEERIQLAIPIGTYVHLLELVRHAQGLLFPRQNLVDVAAAVSLTAFGPWQAGDPPPQVVENIGYLTRYARRLDKSRKRSGLRKQIAELREQRGAQEVISALKAELQDLESQALVHNTAHLVVAYGCGWRCPIAAGAAADDPPGGEDGAEAALLPPAWAAPWDSAFQLFTHLTENATFYTLQELYRRVLPQFLGRDVARGYAAELAATIVENECTCGGGTCETHHRLAAWCPSRHSLEKFILQAVRGSFSRKILPDAFKRSMLFPALRTDYRVTVGTVETKICHIENGAGIQAFVDNALANPDAVPHIGMHVQGLPALYAGDECPEGHSPVRSQTYYKYRTNQLLVPEEHEAGGGLVAAGTHLLLERRWCGICRNLYPRDLPSCPLHPPPAEWTRPDGAAHVYVYLAGAVAAGPPLAAHGGNPPQPPLEVPEELFPVLEILREHIPVNNLVLVDNVLAAAQADARGQAMIELADCLQDAAAAGERWFTLFTEGVQAYKARMEQADGT